MPANTNEIDPVLTMLRSIQLDELKNYLSRGRQLHDGHEIHHRDHHKKMPGVWWRRAKGHLAMQLMPDHERQRNSKSDHPGEAVRFAPEQITAAGDGLDLPSFLRIGHPECWRKDK
jgi:hypothetical protein